MQTNSRNPPPPPRKQARVLQVTCNIGTLAMVIVGDSQHEVGS